MALDGIVLRAISQELIDKIKGGKVDKVHQPEKDELIINIRNKGSNLKLLVSASSSNPRVYLTDASKQNPANPPMFCMLLRKHLQGGVITDVRQVSLERILVIEIESSDELGSLSKKELIVEIMSKHSNIILIKKDEQKIIDSIKRIPVSVSSVRQVLPGLEYFSPPSQNKIDPLSMDRTTFIESVASSEKSIPVYKYLYKNCLGMSPLIAREICYRADVDSEKLMADFDSTDQNVLYSQLSDFYKDIADNRFRPTIVRDKDNYEVLAFSAVDLTQFKGYPHEQFDSMSYVLENFFISRDMQDRIKQKSSELRKSVSVKLERIMNKIDKQRSELEQSKNRETFKIKGDLLTANLYKINRGDSSVVLENYYSEDLEKIKVELDVRLSPSENAQKYYKRYNKLKHADILLREQIESGLSEAEYLENILYSIDNCTEVQEIEEIKEELVKEGYAKSYHFKRKKPSKAASAPYHYVSTDGFDIFVGKNNRQNDELTLKKAAKDDLWLHTKDIPGSHVIVKSESREIPESTIKEAAMLAAYYSKGRMSSQVAVDYALRRNVKKPSGAKPGMVIYENNSTVYVTPDKLDVANMKKIEN